MRRSSVSTGVGALIVVATLVAPLMGQDEAADNRLRALLRPVPPLPVERVDLTLASPRLEGISSVAADWQGHLYVIHRPAEGDPIVVLDAQGHFLESWGRGLFATPHASASIQPATSGRSTPIRRWSTSSRPTG